MGNGTVTTEEMERFKRFHAEQFKAVGVQLIEIKKKVDILSPANAIAPQTKDLLARQVEKMFKDIRFLNQRIIDLEKKLPGGK